MIVALDDDGGGTLSIDELADFVERGSATFHAGPEEKKPEEPEKKPEPIKAKKLRKVISVNLNYPNSVFIRIRRIII